MPWEKETHELMPITTRECKLKQRAPERHDLHCFAHNPQIFSFPPGELPRRGFCSCWKQFDPKQRTGEKMPFMSIRGSCRCKQNSEASHFHYEKKINTMPSQKTHRLCDLRSDASENTYCLDMSRIERHLHGPQNNFIAGGSWDPLMILSVRHCKGLHQSTVIH